MITRQSIVTTFDADVKKDNFLKRFLKIRLSLDWFYERSLHKLHRFRHKSVLEVRKYVSAENVEFCVFSYCYCGGFSFALGHLPIKLNG